MYQTARSRPVDLGTVQPALESVLGKIGMIFW
jgi:hypothetical protein